MMMKYFSNVLLFEFCGKESEEAELRNLKSFNRAMRASHAGTNPIIKEFAPVVQKKK